MAASLFAGIVAATSTAWAESIVFPPGAQVANVLDYGATPDDDTDDTEAFQRALRDEPYNWLIYVPDGRYLISEALHWAPPRKRQILQGQSEAGTIIQLKDRTPKFGNPKNPEAMIWTGKAPAQRFRNGIRNLTIDTGKGNPGAIGARFIANNQGGLQHVTFRSGDPDGRGVIGLDLGYTDEQGPCFIKHVTVIGFDVGVSTRHGVNSVTFEHLSLQGQRVAGLRNQGQVVSIRGLISTNAAPAIVNASGSSLLTLLDAELTGIDGADGAALINAAGLFARNIQASGYDRAIQNTGGHGRSPDGLTVVEFTSHNPVTTEGTQRTTSLNLPVPETPTVEWEPVDRWVSVTDFGPPETIEVARAFNSTVNPLIKPDYGSGKKEPKPKPHENWGPALQRAIDSGATTIYFPHQRGQKDYNIFGEVRLRGNVKRIIGLETALGRIVDSNTHRHNLADPALVPTIIVEDGASDVVVFERFNTWYWAPRFEQRSKRTLVISSMSIYDLETYPGAGDVFLEDVRAKKVIVNGTRLWARQLNTEGWEEPRNLVNGGQMWVLGLKTESDSTIARIQNGGDLEICGAFIYANKNWIDPKVIFINGGGRLSATFGEFVAGKGKAFDVIETHSAGQILRIRHGQAHGRAGGSMAPLLASDVP